MHHTGESTARAVWREAVAEIAAKAKATLPDCAGRVDAAVKLVLAGDVELLEDGTAKVASQSNGTTKYFVVNGGCTCPDFAKAPSNWCKHRIAFGIQKRAAVYATQKLAQSKGASKGHVDTLPQAAHELDTPGMIEDLKPFLVTLHGKPFVRYIGLLALAHARGLVPHIPHPFGSS
jgi:hypothetical protein